MATKLVVQIGKFRKIGSVPVVIRRQFLWSVYVDGTLPRTKIAMRRMDGTVIKSLTSTIPVITSAKMRNAHFSRPILKTAMTMTDGTVLVVGRKGKNGMHIVSKVRSSYVTMTCL